MGSYISVVNVGTVCVCVWEEMPKHCRRSLKSSFPFCLTDEKYMRRVQLSKRYTQSCSLLLTLQCITLFPVQWLIIHVFWVCVNVEAVFMLLLEHLASSSHETWSCVVSEDALETHARAGCEQIPVLWPIARDFRNSIYKWHEKQKMKMALRNDLAAYQTHRLYY